MSKFVALATTLALTFVAPGEASQRTCGVARGTHHYCHRQSDVNQVEFFVVDGRTKERFFIRVNCSEKRIQTIERTPNWADDELKDAAAWACKRYFGNNITA